MRAGYGRFRRQSRNVRLKRDDSRDCFSARRELNGCGGEPRCLEMSSRRSATRSSTSRQLSVTTTTTTVQLRRENRLDPEDVETITVIGGIGATRLLSEPIELKRRPQLSIDGKYSIPFTTAVMMVRGNVTLRDYTEEGLRDPAVLAMVPCERGRTGHHQDTDTSGRGICAARRPAPARPYGRDIRDCRRDPPPRVGRLRDRRHSSHRRRPERGPLKSRSK
jgi:hypothetical protein